MAATRNRIRSVLRTLDDASTFATPGVDGSLPACFPGSDENVTGFCSGNLTITCSVNDDWIWARSCWSMTFTSTPNAPSFATSSASSAIRALAPGISIRPCTPNSVAKSPSSRVACNAGNGPASPLSPAMMPATCSTESNRCDSTIVADPSSAFTHDPTVHPESARSASRTACSSATPPDSAARTASASAATVTRTTPDPSARTTTETVASTLHPASNSAIPTTATTSHRRDHTTRRDRSDRGSMLGAQRAESVRPSSSARRRRPGSKTRAERQRGEQGLRRIKGRARACGWRYRSSRRGPEG